MLRLSQLVQDKRVIVCCGAGGVGKTTTSAALALSAAKTGRRALVLTIDPAKRLAEALGIPPTGKEPVKINDEQLKKASIHLQDNGELSAWMLDPRVVLESVVDRFAPSYHDAAQIRDSRMYKALREVVVGLQEYTAAEALYSFEQQNKYDLIVLDTPPSRNALDFLDAPRRLARFLDERTISIFLPHRGKKAGPLVRAASKVVSNALTKTFGESFRDELQSFLSAFGKLFSRMRVHAKGVRELLMSNRSAFAVVTSAEDAALGEALYFKGRIEELGLTSEGFVLNRSYASDARYEHPKQTLSRLGEQTDPVLRQSLVKLSPLAQEEEERIEQDRKLLEKLNTEGLKGGGQGATALPYLDDAAEDLEALSILSDHVLEGGS